MIEKVGPVAYRLALPPELEKIHTIFRVLMLRRYRSNPSHVASLEVIEYLRRGARRDLSSRSQRIEEQMNSISQSIVEKPQDGGSHVGK